MLVALFVADGVWRLADNITHRRLFVVPANRLPLQLFPFRLCLFSSIDYLATHARERGRHPLAMASDPARSGESHVHRGPSSVRVRLAALIRRDLKHGQVSSDQCSFVGLFSSSFSFVGFSLIFFLPTLDFPMRHPLRSSWRGVDHTDHLQPRRTCRYVTSVRCDLLIYFLSPLMMSVGRRVVRCFLHPAPFAMANLRLRLTHLPEPYKIRDRSDRGDLHQRNVPIL